MSSNRVPKFPLLPRSKSPRTGEKSPREETFGGSSSSTAAPTNKLIDSAASASNRSLTAGLVFGTKGTGLLSGTTTNTDMSGAATSCLRGGSSPPLKVKDLTGGLNGGATGLINHLPTRGTISTLGQSMPGSSGTDNVVPVSGSRIAASLGHGGTAATSGVGLTGFRAAGMKYYNTSPRNQQSSSAQNLDTTASFLSQAEALRDAMLVNNGNYTGGANDSTLCGANTAIGGPGITDANRVNHSFREMMKRKEREMQTLNQQHFTELENVIAKRDADMSNLRHDFARLQSDFKYNLQLLEERDRELQSYDVTLSDLQAKLSEKETIILDLSDGVNRKELEINQKLISREEEVKQVLKQNLDLKGRVKSLEEQNLKQQSSYKALVDAMREEKQKQVEEMTKIHETRVKEIQTMFQSEVSAKDQEYRVTEERWKTHNIAMEHQLEQLTREVANLSSHKEKTTKENGQLTEKLRESESNKELIRKEIEDHKSELRRTHIEFSEKKAHHEDTLASLRAELVQQETNARLKREELEKHFQAKLGEHLETLKKVTAETTEKTEFLKNDSNRRIREMERICNEKMTNAQREFDVKSQTMREEFDRRVQQEELRGKEIQVGMESKLKLEMNTVAEEVQKREKMLRSEWEKKVQFLESQNIDLQRSLQEMEDLTRRYNAEKDKSIQIRTELEACQSEDEALRKKLNSKERDYDKLLAEMEWKENQAALKERQTQSEMNYLKVQLHRFQFERDTKLLDPTFDPLFSGDFGPISPLNKPLSSSGNVNSAPATTQGGANSSGLMIPGGQATGGSDPSSGGVQTAGASVFESMLQRENEDLKRQVEECKEIMRQMRLAAEEAAGKKSNSAPVSKSTHEGGNNTMNQPLNVSVELEMRSVERQREYYEEIVTGKDKEIQILKLQVRNLQDERERLLSERGKLMEINNKLRYDLNRATSGEYSKGTFVMDDGNLRTNSRGTLPTGAYTHNEASNSSRNSPKGSAKNSPKQDEGRRANSVPATGKNPNSSNTNPYGLNYKNTQFGGSSSSYQPPGRYVTSTRSPRVGVSPVAKDPANLRGFELLKLEREMSAKYESKIYGIEQSLQDLEDQNYKLRSQLENKRTHSEAITDSMAAKDGGGKTGVSPRISQVGRARERLEQAKNQLQQGQQQGMSGTGISGNKVSVSEKTLSARSVTDRATLSQASAADKLRKLQLKRQEQKDQRAKAVRNWNERDS